MADAAVSYCEPNQAERAPGYRARHSSPSCRPG